MEPLKQTEPLKSYYMYYQKINFAISRSQIITLDNNNNNVSCIPCVKLGVAVISVERGLEAVAVPTIHEEVNEAISPNFKKTIVHAPYITIQT